MNKNCVYNRLLLNEVGITVYSNIASSERIGVTKLCLKCAYLPAIGYLRYRVAKIKSVRGENNSFVPIALSKYI